MAGTYNPETEIVLGFCTYRHTKGFFQKLIAYDNLMNGLQMLSSALSHHPYTGNGRNLSYRKQLFFARKGYSKSLYLHAGADDLFINEAATGTNTQVQYSPDALTEMGKITKEMLCSFTGWTITAIYCFSLLPSRVLSPVF